jgi:hypothetical protein
MNEWYMCMADIQVDDEHDTDMMSMADFGSLLLRLRSSGLLLSYLFLVSHSSDLPQIIPFGLLQEPPNHK